jgi:hypothetical protein
VLYHNFLGTNTKFRMLTTSFNCTMLLPRTNSWKNTVQQRKQQFTAKSQTAIEIITLQSTTHHCK